MGKEQEAMKAIAEGNKYAIKEMLKNSFFDKTFNAIVEGKNEDYTYTIKLNEKTYENVPSLVNVEINDIVKICIPQNNYNQLFISGKYANDSVVMGSQIGTVISSQGSVTVSHGQYYTITSITIPAGGTYIINGSAALTQGYDSEYMSAEFQVGSGTYSLWIPSYAQRVLGFSGGGVNAWAMLSPTTQCIINLVTYGYMDNQFDIVGRISAVKIK